MEIPHDTEFGEGCNYQLYSQTQSTAKLSPKLQGKEEEKEEGKLSTFQKIRQCRHPKEWCTIIFAIEVIFSLGALALLIVVGIDMVELYHINLNYLDPQVGSGPLLLNLVGDSLINHPYSWFDLSGRINFFVNYQFTTGNYGEDGDEIHQIAARIDQAIYNPTPDAVVLFWDSDCSNINEYAMTVAQVSQTRVWYVANLTYVINATLSAGVKYMAVAGPELLGEGQFLLKHLFWRKVDMLNDYRIMTRNTTQSFNLTYINVRHEFLKYIPWYWAYSQWYETVDGEHENARGARHVGRLFGTELQNWLRVYNESLLYAPTPSVTADSSNVVVNKDFSKGSEMEYPPDKTRRKSSSSIFHKALFSFHYFMNGLVTYTRNEFPDNHHPIYVKDL